MVLTQVVLLLSEQLCFRRLSDIDSTWLKATKASLVIPVNTTLMQCEDRAPSKQDAARAGKIHSLNSLHSRPL